ncbi:MAG TPA: hypothetical protein VFD43_10125 [Planctomycetota bacterium]|nr:hypothetical protein [Planctomycetota bacterium]
MADEYDFSKGIRGLTARRYASGSNIVVLDPDVAAVYRDASTVNGALRLLARLAEATSAARGHRRRAGAKRRKRS